VGIKLGPVVELSTGLYSEGSGNLDLGGGIAADLIVSPSLSVETGALLQHRR